jgi:hypothetical protein
MIAGWAPVGETPVVKHTGAREGIGMISAIGMRGEMHRIVHAESMNSALFTAYLDYPIHDIEARYSSSIFLVADRARYRTSNKAGQA